MKTTSNATPVKTLPLTQCLFTLITACAALIIAGALLTPDDSLPTTTVSTSSNPDATAGSHRAEQHPQNVSSTTLPRQTPLSPAATNTAAINLAAQTKSQANNDLNLDDQLDFNGRIDLIFAATQPDRAREDAIETLADIKQPYYDRNLALMALHHALQDNNPALRSAAIDSLALINHPDAADLLLQALNDPSPQLREDALYALLDQPHRYRTGMLVNALGNSHSDIRHLASEALAAQLANSER